MSSIIHTQNQAYPILDVGFPSLLHGPEVKELDVTIVIAGTHTPLRVVVRVPEGHTPAIPPHLPLCWLHTSHWFVLLSGVPNLHTPCTWRERVSLCVSSK